MNMNKIVFNNSRKQKIVGILNDCGKDYIVIHCHGYGPNTKGKYGDTAVTLSNELTKNNVSNLFFDFNGFGESDGEFNQVTVTGALDDLDSAIKHIRKLGFKEIILSGSSFGGNIVLNHTTRDNSIKALVLKAPVSQWELPEIETSPEIFIHDLKKYTIDFAGKINCPMLIIHGTADKAVPIDDSKKLCSSVNKCELLTINDGDHRLIKQQSQWVPEVIKFINRIKCE